MFVNCISSLKVFLNTVYYYWIVKMDKEQFRKALMEALTVSGDTQVLTEAVGVDTFDEKLEKADITRIGKRLAKRNIKFDSLKFEKLDFGEYKYDGRKKRFTKLPSKYNDKKVIVVMVYDDGGENDFLVFEQPQYDFSYINIIDYDGQINRYDYDYTLLSTNIKKKSTSVYIAIVKDSDRVEYKDNSNSRDDENSLNYHLLSFEHQLKKVVEKYNATVTKYSNGTVVYLKDNVLVDKISIVPSNLYNWKMGDSFFIEVTPKNPNKNYLANDYKKYLEQLEADKKIVQELIEVVEKVVA